MSTHSHEPSDFPREPGAFRPSNHFGQRFREREGLDGTVVETCIREGVCKTSQESGKLFLEADVFGECWRLVVSRNGGGWEVVTAYRPDDDCP